MSLEEDPSLDAAMNARINLLMSEAADEAADVLVENLNSTSGSGVHYPRLPNRSSAPGEYPVRQSGRLQAGVRAEERNGPGGRVAIHDDLGKLLGLEFSPPSDNPNQPGTPKRVSGGRAPMWRTMTDPDTLERMKREMEDA